MSNSFKQCPTKFFRGGEDPGLRACHYIRPTINRSKNDGFFSASLESVGL